MQAQDIALLMKKILVGVALAVTPLLILLGGLKFTERVLARPATDISSASK